MKKKKRQHMTYKEAMWRMRSKVPEIGTPAALKKQGQRTPVDGHLGKSSGIEDARDMPAWLRKDRRSNKR